MTLSSTPKTDKQHLDHIRGVFDQLQTANIKLKLTKCDFFKSQIHYLGQLLSQDSVSTLPENLDAINIMPQPQNIKKLRQFLSLTGYKRNHISHHVDTTNILTKLLKKNKPYLWMKIHQKAFFLNSKNVNKHP